MSSDMNKIYKIFITFIVLFAFWISLSQVFDILHLSLGVVSSLLVSIIFYDVFIKRKKLTPMVSEILRFIRYFLWLSVQIVKSNIKVAKIVLDPSLPISPRIDKYKVKLKKDISLTILANSITLTPGTLTIDIDENRNYYIHCLTPDDFNNFLEEGFEEKVREVFEKIEEG